MPNAPKVSHAEEPIFILGLMHRSGTNFLHNLVCLHPACTEPKSLAEDFLISKLSALEMYVEGVQQQWNPRWNRDGKEDLLRGELGGSLIRFANDERQDREKRLVTKTPTVESLKLFRRYFPRARLLVIVRNGEATVESARVSFQWSFHESCIRWARSAAIINKFSTSDSGEEGHLVVKYEDLITDLDAEMRRILTFLKLPVEPYDFNLAGSLPVKGSSELKAGASGELHWREVSRSSDFNPLSRAKHWSRFRRERFSVAAGRQSRDLGYSVVEPHIGAKAQFILAKTGFLFSYYLRRAKRLWRRNNKPQDHVEQHSEDFADANGQ